MAAFRSLLARGHDRGQTTSRPGTPTSLPLRRKALYGVAVLLALCATSAFTSGAHAAMSTASSYGPVFTHAPFAEDISAPGTLPVTSFDAIWPSLHDVDGVFAQPFAQNTAQHTDISPFGMRMQPDEHEAAIVCSRLASMCLPLADLYDEQLANVPHAHRWSGHIIPLPTSDVDGAGLTASTIQASAGPIDTTLRDALAQAGLPASIATQITALFAGHVDPDAPAQAGDAFRVMLSFADGQGTPRIASISLLLQGETYDALWFTAPDSGQGAYYTLDGKLLAGRPFAMPLDYRRVSSPFGMRTHPVFGEPRFHAGVDLTAPIGTPIYAAAAGTLELAASGRGYGKLVVLRHDDGYSTRYAHLASWAAGLRSGQRVEQGQVIGYVGRTGTTTGPHLHFEVRRYDQPIDPLTLTSREFIAPLTGLARTAFDARVETARTRLAALPSLPPAAERTASLMKPWHMG
ncbi:M23 family metallopeptidase [Burkholderia sp. Ax-1719]|uniref:peptidoglycan DD-metalloendopeptidase family protein n=1 Tax=Burkholderia sp. Ax-1719 TaxID=2608334 RepID=UPI0014214BC5|nr:M23 family metallopeptidase [Burkholderia sp. Ax-1719]